MKHTKRITAVLLAVIIMLSGAVTVLAQEVLPTPADNVIDTSAYVKTVLDAPKVKQDNAVRFLMAANILTDADEKIEKTLSEDVLTGQNVMAVIDGLIEAIEKKMESDPSLAAVAGFIKYLFTSETIGTGLKQDEKFAGAVEKLQKAEKDGYSTIPDMMENGVEFTSADFGFADGDAYGFVDAVVCSLSEIFYQLDFRGALGDFTDSVKNGEYVVGNYNLFVPVYELLELAPISSVEFTKQVKQAENAASSNDKARLRAVADLTLKPMADLLTKIENGGLDVVIDLLPKLFYALDSGMINDLVRNLLQNKTLLYMIRFNDMLENLNIGTDTIWNIIDKKYITGTEEEPAGFDFDKDEIKETVLPLTKEQFDAVAAQLAFAADPLVKASVSSTEKNRLALKTDSALVSAILCDAAVEFIETQEGAEFVKTAAVALKGKTAGKLADFAVSMFRSNIGRFILNLSQGMLAEIAPAAARSIKIIDILSFKPAE